MVYTRPSELYPQKWNAMRWAIFAKYGYRCQMCGRYAKGNLCLHHKIPIKISKNSNPNNLMCICTQCHELIHKDYIERKKRFDI
jgi:predicted HNH restriction endonuclease